MTPEDAVREPERAREVYRGSVIRETGREAAEAAFLLGALERNLGRTIEARAAFELAAASGDAEVGPKAWGNLAVLEAMDGRPGEARAAFQKAIDSGHPDHAPQALFNRAAFERRQGETETARELYRRAVESGHHEHGRKALINLGNLELEQGRLGEAEELFRRAAESGDPDTAERGRAGLRKMKESHPSYFDSPPPYTGADLEFLRRHLPVDPERIDRAHWAAGRAGYGHGPVEIWAGDEEHVVYLDPRYAADFKIYMFLKERFGLDAAPKEPETPPESEFDAACRRGEKIDALLWENRPDEAEEKHRAALAGFHASGRVDAFLVAKHALGLLYALVSQKRHGEAHALWTGRTPPESELWVHCLESGQIGGRDSACYALLGAYLASLATDRHQALESMKHQSALAVEWAVEHGDAEVCSSALSNWRLHLYEIYEGGAPPSETRELQDLARRAGLQGGFWSDQLWFPRLSPWRVDWTAPDAVTSIRPEGGSG
ncbi:tetratricopeptide repeat protein [Actinocorallia sp. B10E7]|uniref:tetratricopeptide repeat protein n=1 Tax=Actinocorallia sp. B10E7 TaxID=3153558 RepID=UPI00325DA25F